MRFGRSASSALPSEPSGQAVERVVRRTSRSLAIVTLALIAALLAGVGVVTAAVALRTSEEQIDRALKQAADVRLAALQQQAEQLPPPTPTPTPTPSPSESPDDSGSTDEPGDGDDNSGPGSDNSGSGSDNSGPGSDNSGSGSDNSGPGSDNSGSGSDNSGPGSDNSGPGSDNSGRGNNNNNDRTRTPRPTRTPRATPTPTPTVTPTPAVAPTPVVTPTPTFGLPDLDNRPPESADTFFLLLDPSGAVLQNPQPVPLIDLPDRAAAAAAVAKGEDWRTITANGVRVRLLSQRVDDPRGEPAGVLQSGFVLRLEDQQTAQLLWTIGLASFTGLCGAALVTLLVTQRAMRPIRSAVDSERRFVASASHELRTPVAVVRASAEILQREDLIKPDGKKLVEDIIAESDRLGRLVGDMLALASAEAGAITVDPREIEMRAFVTAVAGRAEALAAERGVRIEVIQDGDARPGDRELIVSADPDRMTQLLLIFIDNAIDHSPPGGTVRLFVRPAVEGGRQQVAVGVADEGPGVPREARAHIFEPFARLPGRRRETGNTGLGLAIARILAARQQASLVVGDSPTGGAQFSVLLPRRLPTEPRHSA